MKHTIILFILVFNSSLVSANSMNQKEMEEIVANKVKVINQKKGYITFTYQKVKMALISDAKYDRMRIIASITKYSTLATEKKNLIIEANFHSALDARYAVSKNILYSAYIHPISALGKDELESALNQVATLARTFGSTYSSSELSFGRQ